MSLVGEMISEHIHARGSQDFWGTVPVGLDDNRNEFRIGIEKKLGSGS